MKSLIFIVIGLSFALYQTNLASDSIWQSFFAPLSLFLLAIFLLVWLMVKVGQPTEITGASRYFDGEDR